MCRFTFVAPLILVALTSCTNPLLEAVKTIQESAASPKISVSMAGSAVSAGGSVALGDTMESTTIQATVTVSNTGATALKIDPAAVALTMGNGTPAGTFTLDFSALSASIEPGASGSFSVGFTPPSASAFSAVLSVPSNDVNAGTFSFTLTGAGLTTPNAPTGLGASSGDGQATVVWSAVPGAAGYNLYYSTTSGAGTAGTKISGVSSPYTLSGLSNGTTYYLVMTTVSSGLESAASAQTQATPQITAAGAPTGVTATAGNMSATITWTAVAGATGYNLYYSTGSAPTKAVYLVKREGVSSGLTIKELDPAATYYFVVTALNPTESECSNPAAVKPLTTPYAPTISASAQGANRITVTADLNEYVDGYTLYYSTSSGVSPSSYQGSSTSYAADSGAHTVTFDVSGLSAGTTYYFVMTSANGSKVSAASNRSQAMTSLVAPSITAASILVDDGHVYLPWTAPGNGSGVTYTVMRSTDGVSYSPASSGIAALYYLDSAPTNWATYYFKVRAIADDGTTTAESAAVSAMPVHQALAVLNFNSDTLDIDIVRSPAYSAANLSGGIWTTSQVTSGALVGDGPSSLVQHPSMGYIYEGNSGGPSASLGVYSYSIDASGALTSLIGGRNNGVYHEAMALAVKGGVNYLYAADKGTTGLYVYEAAANGGLAPITDAVASAAGTYLRALSITPDSKYLYVSNLIGNKVSAFSIGTDGKLAKIADYDCAASPYKSAVSPDGKYLYVPNWGAALVTAYSIDPGTGALTLVATYAVGANPTSVAVDATSSYVYVACGTANAVYSFAIGTGGALSQIGSATATGSYPNHLSIDYGNQCLAVACADSNLVYLYTIDRSTGALSSTITVGTGVSPGFATWIKLP